MKVLQTWTVSGLIFALPILATAANRVFPAGAVINVNDPEFNPGGNKSDYYKIQHAIYKAMDEYSGTGRYVYLPNGTYNIDSSLVSTRSDGGWFAGLTMIGQNRDSTIIKLKNTAPLFDSPTNPRGVIRFAGQAGDSNGVSGFNNYLQNLSVDIGTNHPGAIAVDYMGNNLGGIEDVRLIGKTSLGVAIGNTGISMARKSSGPALIKRVEIVGFGTGLLVDAITGSTISSHEAFNLTIEDLTLSDQSDVGISVYKTSLAIKGLISSNSVPVIKVHNRDAVLFIQDAEMNGGNSNTAAIRPVDTVDPIFVYARNVKSSGYASAFSGTMAPPTSYVAEYAAGGVHALHSSRPRSLGLPVFDTPEYWEPTTANWAEMPPADEVCAKDTFPDRDDAPAINAAISSAVGQNKTVIWFPKGCYYVGSPISINGSIRQVIGTGTYFRTKRQYADTNVIFNIENLDAPLQIRHLIAGAPFDTAPQPVMFRHNSSQPLTLKEILIWSAWSYGIAYQSMPGAGNVFIENVSCQNRATWKFRAGQNIWARQFNIEGFNKMVENDGATLWIHGMKTEKYSTVIETKNGGKTELIGGLLKGTFDAPTVPAFINDESYVSLGYVDNPIRDTVGDQNCGWPTTCQYSVQVKQTRRGDIRELSVTKGLRLLSQGVQYGFICPLYVGQRKSSVTSGLPSLSPIFP